MNGTKKKTFAMHPQLLWDVITKQAGTLGKALLEGVMNSVDAGATRVELQINATGFKLADDGRGFSGEDEVTEFFATFGTPHTEGDARFGRFRMGRGQMFSFAKTTWASNRSVMDVDIKTHGLDFHYRELPEARLGCEIIGHFYDLLDARGLLTACAEIERNCLYLEIPLIINGEQANKDPAKQKWTHETEEARFSLRSGGTTGISVYQQGVFVETIPASEFGLSGVVVTRVGHPLRVNFARNQVIRSCPLFKRVVGAVKVESRRAVAKRSELDDSERDMLISETVREGELGRDCLSARIFTDATGRTWSARQIAALIRSDRTLTLPNGRRAYSVADKGDLLADRMMQEGRAFVFERECFAALGGDAERGLSGAAWFRGSCYHMGMDPGYAEFVPLQVLAKDRDRSYLLLEEAQLTVKERLVRDVSSDCADMFLHETDQALGIARGEDWHRHGRRTIRVGICQACNGWTDGKKYIAISRKFIAQLNLSSLSGFTKLGVLLLHEYCHQDQSSTTHVHTSEFYRAFHDASYRALDLFVANSSKRYLQKLRAEARALNRKERLGAAKADERATLTAAVMGGDVAAKAEDAT